jgi:cytosine/adenosine deaminase-related metal-dependent hydrolase
MIDYRNTVEGSRRFANPDIYQKSLDFQEEMARHGIAWHNHYADECTPDFCCCHGDNLSDTSYHTYIPSFRAVVKQALDELKEKVSDKDRAHFESLVSSVLATY